MATLLPNGEQTFSDANGVPLAGGSVYFYIPSTTTPKDTWQDSDQNTLNTNPIILDAAGRAIIYGSGTYRQQVYDSAGNLQWDQLTASTDSGGISWGGTSTGSANAQTISASDFSQQDGQQISFLVGVGLTNTAATTLAPGSGSSPIPVLVDSSTGPAACQGGELVAGNEITVVYDLARGAFHLVNPAVGIINSGRIAGATIILKQSASPAPTASGDIQWSTGQKGIVVGDGTVPRAFFPTGSYMGFANGRLTRTGSTTVALVPIRGNLVSFPSGDTAVIPSSGITSTITSCYVDGTASQALSAGTLYYAYLWNQGSAASPNYVIDWSTTGHSADTATGIEIKTGSATRVLVGMAYPTSGPVVQDSLTARLVASWANRSPKTLQNTFTTGRSTTSASYTEINSEIRVQFVSWGDTVQMAYAGAANSNGSNATFSGPSIDAAGSSFPATKAFGTTSASVSTSGATTPSEGFHFATLMGAVSGGTSTWDNASSQSMLSVSLVS